MATCTTDISLFAAENGTLDVSAKYLQLMKDSLGDDSLYQRTKDTLYTLFQDLNLTEEQKAGMVADHMVKFGTDLSGVAMQMAVSWSKEERDGAYMLAKIKADTEVSLAELEKVKSEICLLDKETALKCSNITAVSAASIRENGSVSAYEADGCTAKTLSNSGLKYEQTQQVKAASYQVFADSYRKSGKVTIGTDTSDGITKGISGDSSGYTNQQIQNAERQRQAFEDSKVNHAANSSASMIGQMLTAEVAPNPEDVQRWRDALDRLLTQHPDTTFNPTPYTPTVTEG